MKRLEDLIFGRQQAIVMDYLYEVMGTEAIGHVQIVPTFPGCWMAFVPTKENALLLGYRNGYIRVIDIGRCRGFYPNGNMRLVGMNDVTDKLDQFFLIEDPKYIAYRSPLTCGGYACNSTASNCVECNAS